VRKLAALSEYVTNAAIQGGRLRIRNRRAFDLALAAMTDGSEVLVSIERVRATRSQAQNRWYWGCIVKAISDTTGYDPLEVHELLKEKFLPKTLALPDKDGIANEFVIGGSTTKLNKVEFGEYCETVRRWAAECLAIDIPDPVLS
jgi:hypothetical protein